MADPDPSDPSDPAPPPVAGAASVEADGLGYAAAVAELEEILDRLDDEGLDVDVLAREVRRAAELIRLCRRRIDAARVEVDEVVAELGAVTAVTAGAGPGTAADTLADGGSDDV